MRLTELPVSLFFSPGAHTFQSIRVTKPGALGWGGAWKWGSFLLRQNYSHLKTCHILYNRNCIHHNPGKIPLHAAISPSGNSVESLFSNCGSNSLVPPSLNNTMGLSPVISGLITLGWAGCVLLLMSSSFSHCYLVSYPSVDSPSTEIYTDT